MRGKNAENLENLSWIPKDAGHKAVGDALGELHLVYFHLPLTQALLIR